MLRNAHLFVLATTVAAGLSSARAEPSANALPEGDFENAKRELPELWHRMGDYAATARDAWRIDRDTAHSGKASAVGTRDAEYVMQAEVSPAGKWVVEGFAKAERDGAQCQVRVGWYSNWSLANERKRSTFGRDWTPFRVEADLNGGKIGGRGTVVEVGVMPQSEGRFWLDDVTLRRVAGKANAPRKLTVERPSVAALLEDVEPRGSGRQGEIKLRFLDMPSLGIPLCTRVALPFAQGELFAPSRVSIVGADRKPLRAQARVLSRWLADSSIQSLLLDFTLPPGVKAPPVVRYGEEGRQTLAAVASAPDTVSNAAVKVALAAAPEAVLPLGGGTAANSPEAPSTLISGPLVGRWRCQWAAGSGGNHIGTHQLWINGFADAPRADMQYVFINDGEPFVADLESVSLHLPIPVAKESVCHLGLVGGEPLRKVAPVAMLQTARDSKFEYQVLSDEPGSSAPGRLAGWVVVETGNGAWGIAVRDFWWKHPSAIRIGPEGVRVDLWPEEVRDLRLSRGAAPSLRLSLVHGRSAAEIMDVCGALAADPQPLVVADIDAYCRSGTFGVALTPDRSPFPIFEKTLAEMSPLTHWTFSKWSKKEKLKRHYHGRFDYGDGPGDGGWSNAETMLDHAFYQWFFRTGEREHFDVAQALARHFRDIDVGHPYGEVHCHCMNHTLSGASPSHSWIQGMRDDYLLTGNLRTLEVLHECGRWLCSLPVEKETGRNLTRIFDNIVDLYLFTANEQFRCRALDYARELGKRQDPARVLSGAAARSWFEHRYTAGTAFVWYGTYALAKLHRALPTDELKRIFLTELDISLNAKDRIPFIYQRYPDRKGLYPENPGPAFQAQEIGKWAKGRGSVVWPSLAYAHKITGERKYLDVGFRSFGYYCLSMTPDTAIMATSLLEAFRENGFGAKQERALLATVSEELATKYPRSLPDPGFDTEGLDGWTMRNRKGRIESARDTEVKLAGPSSLRMSSFTPHHKHYATTTYYCHRPGRYSVRVWCKPDKGVHTGFAVNYKRFLPPEGRTYYAGRTERHPDRPEWRTLETTVDAPAPGTLQFLVYNSKSVGSVWYDSIEIKRTGDVPPDPQGALLNPGFEAKTLTGWSRAAPWRGDYSPDPSRAAQGRQSLRIRGLGNRDGYVEQRLQLEPGREYRLSVCVVAQNNGVPAVTIEGKDLLVEGRPARRGPAGWQVYSAAFRAPSDGQVIVKLHNTAGEGIVWFDDVRIE